MSPERIVLDGNEAVARIAYQLSEVIAIYPITPSSPMGEWADQWASEGRPNLWESTPRVVELQSEGGAAGAIHGALQAGALTTTFTASQGLLLMIPNMYKIAGELTSAVFHVASRSIAAQALSIFCDHSDVMATRGTGFALLSSASVQEAMDLALIAHVSTLKARIPFLHFFDGFRTSHEIATVSDIPREVIRELVDDTFVRAHRERGLSPEQPCIRGTAQNPDVFFQARESVNPYYEACPELVAQTMAAFGELTGRHYGPFDYVGSPDADRVLVAMGSACEAAHETVETLQNQGERVGLLKVRLYRPFDGARFVDALPESTRAIAVLDRTKEPGSNGEPLYLDVVSAVNEWGTRFERRPTVIGGRYGLSSKEFTPEMVAGVFGEVSKPEPKNRFTIGIVDDVTHTSLDYDRAPAFGDTKTRSAAFFGLGADGTVGANKNTIHIIGDRTDLYAQGYFVYDSKKAGSTTVSHLRFGPEPIRSSYLVREAEFVACHQDSLLERFDVLKYAAHGATLLLNTSHVEDVWAHLPRRVQEGILEKELKVWAIDAYSLAKACGLGRRINTIMQTCFFARTDLLPIPEAIDAIKEAIEKTYGKRGRPVVDRNLQAVDSALENLFEVDCAGRPLTDEGPRWPHIPDTAPAFVRDVTSVLLAGEGDSLPVSALPADGTYPTGTAQYERRNIAQEIPVWDPDICIQCGKCVLVCPHGVIRSALSPAEALEEAPATLKTAPAKWKVFEDQRYMLQVAPEDCTGCTLCVQVCPVKNKAEPRLKAINMEAQAPLREAEKENWEFFRSLGEPERNQLHLNRVRDVQVLEPLFEFSGACAGCGETPYIKLMTQLFGDRAIVANATGCSSIYGGNLPTTPWTTNAEGHGPAWSNSLFEDNAEFGLGMRLAIDTQAQYARSLVQSLASRLGEELADGVLAPCASDSESIRAQRDRVARLKDLLSGNSDPKAQDLVRVADTLVPRSVWIVGGDGWAYDIGFGGLDHVLASGENVNVLVLDTEVYSNTGGQTSKATPRAAVAKFSAAGKSLPKKDLVLMATSYGSVYVARVAMGADDAQTLHAFQEAESYDGPSLILAYSHCIAHGYDLAHGMDQQKAAVDTGYWPLCRYDPRRAERGENPFLLDSKRTDLPLREYVYKEGRYNMLVYKDPERADELLRLAQSDVDERWRLYEDMAQKPTV